MTRYLVTYYVREKSHYKKVGTAEICYHGDLNITLPSLAFLQAPDGCRHADKVTFEVA